MDYFVSEMGQTSEIAPHLIVYLNFSHLLEIAENPEQQYLMDVIRNARYLCIDELEANMDPKRINLFQQVIEHRVANSLFGTFITSNYSLEELLPDEKQCAKIESRLSQSMILFDFSDAKDFRTTILRLVTVERTKAEIDKRLAALHSSAREKW
ncbi:MAG: hypothetical protein N2654_01910 [Deltaproteobacteria bacterium]|nr:hypothetical protein [Deltaproteobacteria bacterium]